MLQRYSFFKVVGGVFIIILISTMVWFLAGGADYCCNRLYLRRQNQIELLENQQQLLSEALCNYYIGTGDYITTANLIGQVRQTQDSINSIEWQIEIAEDF